jgi:hypothetical protein
MGVCIVDDVAQRASNVEALDFFAKADRALAAADEGQERIRVAFDCEGVDLSRCGSIETVTLVFDTPGSAVESIFLVDVGKKSDATLRGQRIKALKNLFECKTVEKIIHDCRMDCDALYHHCDIRVNNVLDTSCMHAVITGVPDKSLNYVLSHNGIAENGARDKAVYQRNPRFWATRPFTATMIDWASSDVDKLAKLADKQIHRMDSADLTRARLMSSDFASQVVKMKVEQGLVVRTSIGRFIGTRGANLRSLQSQTDTLIYQSGLDKKWFVYYSNQSGLDSVKRAMGDY